MLRILKLLVIFRNTRQCTEFNAKRTTTKNWVVAKQLAIIEVNFGFIGIGHYSYMG